MLFGSQSFPCWREKSLSGRIKSLVIDNLGRLNRFDFRSDNMGFYAMLVESIIPYEDLEGPTKF